MLMTLSHCLEMCLTLVSWTVIWELEMTGAVTCKARENAERSHR